MLGENMMLERSIWLSTDASNSRTWDVARGWWSEIGHKVDGIGASAEPNKQKSVHLTHEAKESAFDTCVDEDDDVVHTCPLSGTVTILAPNRCILETMQWLSKSARSAAFWGV
jgi:hypothetical protein